MKVTILKFHNLMDTPHLYIQCGNETFQDTKSSGQNDARGRANIFNRINYGYRTKTHYIKSFRSPCNSVIAI